MPGIYDPRLQAIEGLRASLLQTGQMFLQNRQQTFQNAMSLRAADLETQKAQRESDLAQAKIDNDRFMNTPTTYEQWVNTDPKIGDKAREALRSRWDDPIPDPANPERMIPMRQAIIIPGQVTEQTKNAINAHIQLAQEKRLTEQAAASEALDREKFDYQKEQDKREIAVKWGQISATKEGQEAREAGKAPKQILWANVQTGEKEYKPEGEVSSIAGALPYSPRMLQSGKTTPGNLETEKDLWFNPNTRKYSWLDQGETPEVGAILYSKGMGRDVLNAGSKQEESRRAEWLKTYRGEVQARSKNNFGQVDMKTIRAEAKAAADELLGPLDAPREKATASVVDPNAEMAAKMADLKARGYTWDQAKQALSGPAVAPPPQATPAPAPVQQRVPAPVMPKQGLQPPTAPYPSAVVAGPPLSARSTIPPEQPGNLSAAYREEAQLMSAVMKKYPSANPAQRAEIAKRLRTENPNASDEILALGLISGRIK